MFIVLTRGERAKNKLQAHLRKNKFTVEQRQVAQTVFYAIDTATDFVPWDKIRTVVGRNVQFLVEEDVSVPADILLFHGNALVVNAFRTQFKSHLKSLSMPRLTVVDYQGELVSEIANYFAYATQIRVVSDKIELYTAHASTILRQTGASLLVSSDIHSAMDSDVLFAPRGIRGTFFAPQTMQVFSLFPDGIQGGVLFYPKFFQCDGALLDDIPAKMSETLFLCALYELGHAKSLEKINLDIGRYI